MSDIDKFRLLAKLRNRRLSCSVCKHHKYYYKITRNTSIPAETMASFTACEYAKNNSYTHIDVTTRKEIIQDACNDFEGDLEKLSAKYIYPPAEDWDERDK